MGRSETTAMLTMLETATDRLARSTMKGVTLWLTTAP